MASLFSTTSQIAAVNTRARSGVITLPLTTASLYRQIMIKDLYGAFPLSTLTISTQLGDYFEDGTTSRILCNAYEFQSLYAGSTSRWHTVGGTQFTAAYISSLRVDSLQLGSGDGWADFGPLRATAISSLLVQTGLIQAIAMSTFVISTGTLTAGNVSTLGLNVGSLSSINISTVNLAAGNISTITFGANTAYVTNLFVGNEDFGSVLTASSNITQTGGTTTLAGLSVNTISTNFITASNISTNSLSTNFGFFSTISTGTVYGRHIGDGSLLTNLPIAGVTSILSTQAFFTSSISTGNITSIQGYISSLTVDYLAIGSNVGFVNMGDIIATSLSSIAIESQTLTTSNLKVGVISSLSYIAFPGLQQGYAQSVLAEQSTGTGLQELLVFRGSSASDRIRMQTTGSIVFEPGVSARVYPAVPSNVTPAMIINSSSNVGIGIAAPTTTLDVAGTGRFQILSTQQLFVSTISSGTIYGRYIGDGSLLTGLPASGLSIIPPVLSTTTLSTNLLTASNISTNSISTNNLTVSNLYGNGIAVLPGLSVNTISTNQVNSANISTVMFGAGTAYITNLFVGNEDFGSVLTSSSNIIQTGGTTILAGLSVNTISTNSVIANGISSASISTINLTVNNLIIPYSTLNTSTYFQLRTSSSQMFFGTYGPSSQIYIGDLKGANNNITDTDPLLLIEQKPIILFTGGTSNYSYTGSTESFIVPTGITSLNVSLTGAGGGGGNGNAQTGGTGGFVSGKLSVTPGETLTVIVGKGGILNSSAGSSTFGGGGGAGAVFGNVGYAGSGGGRTAIQRSGADIVTAGGGGGGGQGGGGGAGQGGAGGGLTGGRVISSGYGGYGGTQSAGGAGGGGTAEAGVLAQGGRGDTGSYTGGGGGGYYGGGGATNTMGGGGGSSYVANLTGTVVNTQGGGASQNTNGSMTISYDPAPPASRPGNLMEIRNYLANKFIVDPFLNVGINVSTILSTFQLDVNGAFRATSVNVSTISTTTLRVGQSATFISNIEQIGGTTILTGLSVNTISTNQINSSNICNAGFLSNNGILSNTTAGAFFQATSNTTTLGVAGVATFANNITQTAGTTILTTLSANYAFFSTISTGSVFGRFIGDGSGLTGISGSGGTGVTNILSTLQFFVSSISSATIQTSNIRIGTISSQSFLAYPGLTQGYAQTVIAEQSTGTGLQELLIFRGSSASDRIRLQTTGFICFETGVGARTFPSVGSNATPSWMIDVNGCVGVGLIPSGTASKLDVAGQGRFQNLSTTSIQAGSINLSVAFV